MKRNTFFYFGIPLGPCDEERFEQLSDIGCEHGVMIERVHEDSLEAVACTTTKTVPPNAPVIFKGAVAEILAPDREERWRKDVNSFRKKVKGLNKDEPITWRIWYRTTMEEK